MKMLLLLSYLITIGEAYYTTVTIEQKTPPQLQLGQVSVKAVPMLLR